jgi:hypothetical protein
VTKQFKELALARSHPAFGGGRVACSARERPRTPKCAGHLTSGDYSYCKDSSTFKREARRAGRIAETTPASAARTSSTTSEPIG